MAIIFPVEVEHEWERQQANLEALVEEATRNENSLFNPEGFCENLKVQLESNILRWILIPNEELFFTNGRIVNDAPNIPESSVTGKMKNYISNPREDGQPNWLFQMEVTTENPPKVLSMFALHQNANQEGANQTTPGFLVSFQFPLAFDPQNNSLGNQFQQEKPSPPSSDQGRLFPKRKRDSSDND